MSPQAALRQDEDPMVAEALRQLEIRNPPFPVELRQVFGSLEITVTVKDRDTGKTSRVCHPFLIPGILDSGGAASYFRDQAALIWWIREQLRRVFLHELDESLIVQGVRYWDPHR